MRGSLGDRFLKTKTMYGDLKDKSETKILNKIIL